MKVLDLFCGGGGISVGYFNAGFEVVGVDVEPQRYYPFEFIQKSVFDLDLDYMKSFDLIHASPPCQAYSFSTQWIRNKGLKQYLDLVQVTRNLLESTGKPYVIENVPGAPLRKDLVLCGDMFDLGVIRHRHFEIKGFKVQQLKHIKHKGMVADGSKMGVYGGNPRNARTRKRYTVASHMTGTLAQWKNAMGIFWINNKHILAQAIPPKYSEYIGKQFLKSIPESRLEINSLLNYTEEPITLESFNSS